MKKETYKNNPYCGIALLQDHLLAGNFDTTAGD